MQRGKLIIPLAAVMLAMFAVAHIAPSSASAQYPTPKGALLCQSGAITAQTNSSFQFTATIVDIMGAPVPGNAVFFTVSGGATLSTNTATTDGNGQAFVTVNTGAAGGQIVVTATADQFVCRAIVNIPVEVPNIQCSIQQLYQFNSQYTFTVTLRSTTTVLIGQTINFFITSTGGGASLSQIAAITDGSGNASVIVYVLPNSGSVTVTANYNGMTCPATINVPPPQPPCQSPNPPAYCFPPPTFVQQVVPPVQYIVPPYTGDAGLASNTSSSRGVTDALAGLTLIAAVAGLALLARRVTAVNDVPKSLAGGRAPAARGSGPSMYPPKSKPGLPLAISLPAVGRREEQKECSEMADTPDRRALITGITGQDGSYLAEFLLDRGYEVHGIIRRASSFNTSRIDHLYQDLHEDDRRLTLHYGDLSDGTNLTRLMTEIQPHEVYNLAAQSHVRTSFDIPEYTADATALGALRLLDAIRDSGTRARFYQASSSEMFGHSKPVQSETTQFEPCSPYAISKLFAYWTTVNYRESYGIHASNGILFNHESPRRGETFVTRKVTRSIARILAGKDKLLYLGNLEALRDWGYAPEYVEAMWLMLQQEQPDDYVVATGESHSVREFVETAFELVGLNWEDYVRFDARYLRPAEVEHLEGDPPKARKALGWEARTTFRGLVRTMLLHDLTEELGEEKACASFKDQGTLVA